MADEINPVEAVLAVVGLRKVLSKEHDRILKSDWRRVVGLDNEVRRLCRAVVRDEVVDVPSSDFAYEDLLKHLSEPYNNSHVQELIRRFPLEYSDLALGFVGEVGQLWDYLQQQLPISTYVTAAGTVNLHPNELALHRFYSVLEILDDPLRMFPGLATGSLLKLQIQALRKVYPTLCGRIDEYLREAIVAEKTRVKSFELAPAVEIGISKWFGRPAVDPAYGRKLQQNFETAKPKPKTPPQPSQPSGSVLAREAMTPSQKAAYQAPVK